MIVVGCGKQKLDRRAPARLLYTGPLFRAARIYAEESGQPWAIVSAKYGLVHPKTVIEPYEQRLSRKDRKSWAVWVVDELMAQFPTTTVTILAGKDYADPLEEELVRRGIKVKKPLDGMMLGHRLRWFKTRGRG